MGQSWTEILVKCPRIIKIAIVIMSVSLTSEKIKTKKLRFCPNLHGTEFILGRIKDSEKGYFQSLFFEHSNRYMKFGLWANSNKLPHI